MAAQGETEQRRGGWAVCVLFAYASSLLLVLLSIYWGGIRSTFGLPSWLGHAQDGSAEPSWSSPEAKSPSSSTSGWRSSEPLDPFTTTWTLPEGEKYLWYSPHSGFSNQAREFTSALKIAFLLQRTLVLPAVLDHFELEQGSCSGPIRDQRELRKLAWAAISERLDPSSPRTYVSIADIIDLSSIKSTVKTIDLRVFLALWCGVDISRTCFGPVCHSLVRELQTGSSGSMSSCAARFFSNSSGQPGANLIHEVDDDCRTTVWTSGETLAEKLHLEELLRQQLRSDTTLPSDVNASSLSIERKDIIKSFGPASTAGASFLLVFGTLFGRHYKDRTLMVDIPATRHGKRKAEILTAIERQPFSKDIRDAGRHFVQEKIVEPFFCAHVRLDDGAFKSEQESKVLMPLRKRLQQLEMTSNLTSEALNLFVMSDLPREKWLGTYLHDLDDNPKYNIYTMDAEDLLLNNVIQKIYSNEYGLLSGFLPQLKYQRKISVNDTDEIVRHAFSDEENSNAHAFSVRLFVEEVVCSCATLGFQGTKSSTVSRNIFIIRKAKGCPI